MPRNRKSRRPTEHEGQPTTPVTPVSTIPNKAAAEEQRSPSPDTVSQAPSTSVNSSPAKKNRSPRNEARRAKKAARATHAQKLFAEGKAMREQSQETKAIAQEFLAAQAVSNVENQQKVNKS